jgi:hypothetical protein
MRWEVRRSWLGLLVVLVALLVPLEAGGAPARPADGGSLGVGPAHWFGPGGYGTVGKKAPSLPVPASPVDNLVNPGNGEIMPTTNTYLIFWLPSGYHFSSSVGDASYENAMIKYFQDVGGSQILNVATQYPGNNGTPADTSTFVASEVDTTAFPHAGTSADPLTLNDLNQEVFNRKNANSWPSGLSTMYFVFLPNGVVDCFNDGVTCNTNAYCAYHTYGYSGSDTPANDFVWADIPDNRSLGTTLGGCGDSNVTGDESADTTISSVQHEQIEAITDPRLNAWQDSSGLSGEIGDKCNRDMGVANSSSTVANNYLGPGSADPFRMQREWSNAAGGGSCAASYTTAGSRVVAPAPSGSDVSLSVSEASIPGNNGDLLHYTVSFYNPSDQDDAFGVAATITPATGVSEPASVSIGNLAPHQTATRTFTGTVSGGPLAAGTVLTTSVSVGFDDSTGAAQPALVRNASTTVVNTPPSLVLPGAQSQDYNDALSFGISASDPDAGDSISLSASGLPAGLTFTDNGNRTGTVSGTISAAPGVYSVTFAADDHHHALSVSSLLSITVTREETTVVYTGVTGPVLDGSVVTLSGTLQEDGTTAIAGRTLGFTLGSGGGAQTCAGTTDGSGAASCTITVSQPVGSQPVSADFAGDTVYLPSSAASSVVVYTAMSLKQDVLAQASTLLAASTKPDSAALKDIVKSLTDSLDPTSWIDGNHLVVNKGNPVFDKEKDAVQKLAGLIAHGSAIPAATLQDLIDSLEHADRVLAEDAIADALAGSGDPKKIADAQSELAKAASELAAGNFAQAIDRYKNAWHKAEDSLH